ncbi:MAG: DUF4355 domain-containing protein [Cellulosilyticaceae bacterium]
MLKDKWFLGLQFFADEEGDGDESEDKGGAGEKQLTQEQVNEIIQKRLAKEKAKWQKDLDTKLAEEKRLAEMDAEQRKQAELEIKLKALEEREAAIKLQETKIATAGVLKTHGLDESFVDFVIGADDEATLVNINALEKAFKEAVKVEVEKRIPSNDPQGGAPGAPGGMTKEEFKKLPLLKQNELYVSDPEKYKQYF